MAFGYPSSTNVYLPTSSTNVDVTANLVVNFSRNVKDFPLNQYIKIAPVKKNTGYYTRMAIGPQARVAFQDARNFLWNPGQERPKGNWNKMPFQRYLWSTERYCYSTTLDQLTVDLADFQIQPIHVAMLAQQCMTQRVRLAMTVACQAANWSSTHVNTATGLGYGPWSNGTATSPNIQNSLYNMAVQINKDTMGVVRQEHLTLVINPVTAKAMAVSQEIRSYLSNQAQSILYLQGQNPTPGTMYNLPANHIYGFKYIVDDTVMNTNTNHPADDDATNNSYVVPDGTALLLGRPGDLPTSEGSTDFTTLTMFALEEMSTETFVDSKNRLVECGVTDNVGFALVAPIAGYLLQGCL